MVDEGGSIKLRNLIIRDAYKERWLKEKSLEKEKERKNKLEILKKSMSIIGILIGNFIKIKKILNQKEKFQKQEIKNFWRNWETR